MATTNYSWVLPVVDGSANVWGELLNSIFSGTSPDGLDEVIKAVSDVADAAMPKAGGVFTGDVEYAAGSRLIEDDTAMAALAVDFALGNFFSKTLANGAQSITFANPPSSGKVQFITIELTQGSNGDSTVSWPAAVDWDQGSAPTLSTTATGKDILGFYTRDGGTTYIGAHAITDPA